MSQTETGLSIAERLERLKPLAAGRRAANVKRLKNFNPTAKPKTSVKPAKAKKPFYYNPAHRD